MEGESTLDQLKTIQDYSTIERLASVLWKVDNSYHGAAVMVGAGFSRCSAKTGDVSKKMPLWADFSKIIKAQMGSTGTDPLRIAEEYAAYFGRQALNDLIRKEVNDSSWDPGDLHELLLKLPWTEVLSTNWDSLLERSSKEFHDRFYSIVHRQEDLSCARSPRIVKLHGTVNVTENLIFTQEDYRTYPLSNAAFVNFSRQVFIENELCLIGFSGDDPNFLQWAGWVRDHLSTNARRIFLVGALNLSAAKRKYLESINIAPVDLEELVSNHDDQDMKHEKATELFLSALVELKPKPSWEWSPDRIIDKTPMEQALQQLQRSRLEYPGWLICPSHLRFSLHSGLDFKWLHGDFILQLKKDERAKLLYEIAWRLTVSYSPCDVPLAEKMLSVCDFSLENPLSKRQQLEIGVYLLKSSRWFDGDKQELVSAVTSMIEENLVYWPEAEDHLICYDISEARDKFDYRKIEDLLNKFEPSTIDSKIKKAALYGELGEFQRGKELFSDIRNYLLSKYREERNSVYILSRLCFVDEILSSIDFRSSGSLNLDGISRKSNCDFWPHLESLRGKVNDKLKSQESRKGIQVSFEPGIYKDNSATTVFSNAVHPFFNFYEIVYGVGLPVKWDGLNYLIGTAKELSQLNDLGFRERLHFSLLASNSEDDVALQNTISRVKLARVPEKECLDYVSEIKAAIDFWYEKSETSGTPDKSFCVTKIRVYIEALARFSVRLNSGDAKNLFDYAVSLGKKETSKHFWVWKSLHHLLTYSLESIPEEEKHEVILDALSFPLQSEIGSQHETAFHWPNPVIEKVNLRPKDNRIDYRVQELIESVIPESQSCSFALQRLLPLYCNDFLNTAEEDKLRDKIWGKEKSQPMTLPNTGLYYWALLDLPYYDKTQLESVIIDFAFAPEKFEKPDVQHLYEVIGCGNKGLRPSSKKADACFKWLASWATDETRKTRIADMSAQISHLIGTALSQGVVPALGSSSLNKKNFVSLRKFIEKNNESAALLGLVYFFDSYADAKSEIIEILRTNLQALEHKDVARAAFAISKLHSLSPCEETTNLFSVMVEMISLNRDSKTRFVLQCVREAVESKMLDGDQLQKISEIAPRSFDNSNYNIDSKAENDFPFLSLYRAELVKLARELKIRPEFKDDTDLTRILNEAKQDPLPEVRFS